MAKSSQKKLADILFPVKTLLSDYEVISSRFVEIDDNYNGRIDIPIVSVLVDYEDKIVHLVEKGK